MNFDDLNFCRNRGMQIPMLHPLFSQTNTLDWKVQTATGIPLNPSIRGVKFEDTILVGNKGPGDSHAAGCLADMGYYD